MVVSKLRLKTKPGSKYLVIPMLQSKKKFMDKNVVISKLRCNQSYKQNQKNRHS